MDALDRLRQREIAIQLRDGVTSAEDYVMKWRYIDDLIDWMDPGDSFQPWPETLRSACKGLSPIVLKLTGERLKKRQEKVHDKLKKKGRED
jgi:hypothetical protein